jgi:hypothetical protein
MTVTNQLAMEHGILESQRLNRTPAIEGARICEHHALRQTVPEFPGLRSLDEQADRRWSQDQANRACRRTEARRSAFGASRGARRQGRNRAAPSTLEGSAFGAQRTSRRIDRVRAPSRLSSIGLGGIGRVKSFSGHGSSVRLRELAFADEAAKWLSHQDQGSCERIQVQACPTTKIEQ